MAIKVGSFTKATGGAPAVQAVTGVGFTPKVLLLWTEGKTAVGSWSAHICHAAGMTDGTTSRSGCAGAENNVTNNSDTNRRWAAKALTIQDYHDNLLAECDLTSFDADGFTLTWTTNDANAYYIHYLALGGSKLTNKAVKEWTWTTGAGDKAVTGVGFQPDLVIHLSTYSAATGSGGTAHWNIGAMDSGGRQYSLSFTDRDGYAGGGIAWTSNSHSYCLQVNTTSAVPATLGRIVYKSMDADGFTVTTTTAASANHLVASLCLKGGAYYVGYFAKRNGPGSQSLTGAGFLPEGVLFLGGRCVESGVSLATGGIASLGAGDTASCAAATCLYAGGSTNPTQADAAAKSDAAIVAPSSTPVDGSVATITSLDADGCTLNWSAGTASLDQYGWIALEGGPAGVRTLPALGVGT